MDESALERFFDKYIANDSSKMEEEEEEEEDEGQGDELSEDNRDRGTSLDYNSQNSTASTDLPGGSPKPELDVLPIPPTVPVMPVELQRPPKIQNISSTVRLGCCVDLDFIARNAWSVEYRKHFNAVTMRIRNPRTTALIYRSGTIICTGAKSEEQSRKATRKFARIVQKLGFPVRFLNFKIQNVVASCHMFPISLERLALHHRCSYEPELFPALIFDALPGITVMVFSSGKTSLTGAKTEDEALKAFDVIIPLLSSFRRR